MEQDGQSHDPEQQACCVFSHVVLSFGAAENIALQNDHGKHPPDPLKSVP
jgi:hypothetical protein